MPSTLKKLKVVSLMLAQRVRQSVVEENTQIYKDLFESTTDASDPYWMRAWALYGLPGDSDKEVLFEIIRQVTIDSVSNVFAIVDGVSQLEGQDGDIQMSCGKDELSGELQDRFLELFED